MSSPIQRGDNVWELDSVLVSELDGRLWTEISGAGNPAYTWLTYKQMCIIETVSQTSRE